GRPPKGRAGPFPLAGEAVSACSVGPGGKVAYPCPPPARCNGAELGRAITASTYREMTPPRIRTRSGRKPRARFHASWSPASRNRTRRTAVRMIGVLVGLLLVSAVGANVYAASVLSSLPNIKDLDAAKFTGDTIIQDRNGKPLADIG